MLRNLHHAGVRAVVAAPELGRVFDLSAAITLWHGQRSRWAPGSAAPPNTAPAHDIAARRSASALLRDAEAASAATQPLRAAPAQTRRRTHTPRRPVATPLDGRAKGAEWLEELRAPVAEVTGALGRPPGLCVVVVGDRADSRLYVARKEEACQQMGVRSTVVRLPAGASQAALHAAIDAACADAAVDGVLVQLPLPPHLDEFEVMERIAPRKDVDGFHPLNMGRMLARGGPPRFVPATALGCIHLLRRYQVDVKRKNVVVVGDSNIVGTPLAVMLRDAGAGTVTVCHRIAYSNIFGDRSRVERGEARAGAAACLPRLPGPTPQAYARRSRNWGVDRAAGGLVGGEVWEKDAAADGATADGATPGSAPPQKKRVTVSVSHRADATAVEIQVDNRAGLLHLLTSVFRELGLDIVSARAETAAGVARDVFHVTAAGAAGPVRDARKLERLAALVAARVDHDDRENAHLASLTRTADVLVVAVGYPELVRADWVKTGAVVIDVGINVVPAADAAGGGAAGDPEAAGDSTRVVGDVASGEVRHVAAALTPVPGGVGPMTIAALLHNVVLAARYQAGLEAW